ncbi:MAG: endonuclease [Flavobacteriaceae bacterium]|nr:endonuclease [Flavobacteriaceae bacterium]
MNKYYILILLLFNFNCTFSQLVINEIDSDTEGFDNLEFVEIKSEEPNYSLDGYLLVFFNGSSNGADSSYFTLDLSGYQTDLNGLFLIGNNTLSPFPQFIIEDNSIQNGADAIGIYFSESSNFPNSTLATTTNLVDAIVYDTSDSDDTNLMDLLGVSVQINENENNNKDYESIQRLNDGSYIITTPTPREVNEGDGVFLNGINFYLNQNQYNEGESIELTITTEVPVQEDLSISLSLDYQNFNSDDYIEVDPFVIPTEDSSVTIYIDIIDDVINEGDEDLMISLSIDDEEFILLNNNLIIRVNDNDFLIANYGTPINPTYTNVSNLYPENYYNSLQGLSGVDLIEAIQNIIANPDEVKAHSYADVKSILNNSDVNPENSNQVWLVYSEQPRSKIDFQNSSNGTGKWNREHTYPRSRGGFNSIDLDSYADGIDEYWDTDIDSLRHANSDVHGIRAADSAENSSRGNKHYGDYNGPSNNLGSFKGDVARSVLFLSLRYNGLEIVDGYPDLTGQLGDLQTILEWNNLDPVDDFEKNRNNVIYTWQNNRNPLIDFPDLVDYIWGENQGQDWFFNLNVEDLNAKKINLYPNPNQDELFFNIDENFEIEIFSIDGRKILNKIVTSNSFKHNLTKGLYLIKINTLSKKIYKKLIIK